VSSAIPLDFPPVDTTPSSGWRCGVLMSCTIRHGFLDRLGDATEWGEFGKRRFLVTDLAIRVVDI
jgi:hypothetical protein